jgi:cell shape-determining protein MreD
MGTRKLTLYIFLWMVSIFFVLMKGSIISFFGIHFLDIDLVIIITIYLLLMDEETGAGIFALSQGLLIDVYSGGPLGLFTLLYLMLFLGIHIGSGLLDIRSVKGQAIVILLAVLLKGGLLISFLHIFSLETHVSRSGLWAFAGSGLCSGIIGPLILLIFHFVGMLITSPREEDSENGIWI